MPDQIDPYKILQVDSEAEDEVIQAAYRRLARKYHPDLAASPDAANRMAAINAAWELIGEPAKRAAYDRQRAPLATTPVQPAGGTDRINSYFFPMSVGQFLNYSPEIVVVSIARIMNSSKLLHVKISWISISYIKSIS